MVENLLAATGRQQTDCGRLQLLRTCRVSLFHLSVFGRLSAVVVVVYHSFLGASTGCLLKPWRACVSPLACYLASPLAFHSSSLLSPAAMPSFTALSHATSTHATLSPAYNMVSSSAESFLNDAKCFPALFWCAALGVPLRVRLGEAANSSLDCVDCRPIS